MTNASKKKFDGDPPWWYLFIAATFVGLGIYLYFYFTALEIEGGSRRINWVLALLYEVGGKWAVIGLVFILVLFCIYLAMREFRRRQS